MEVQVCLVGSRLCCGVPVDYFLLVEERETAGRITASVWRAAASGR